MSTIYSPIIFIVVNSAEELYEIATTESSFIFDNKLYKQIGRVAMGTPLGPTLANAFLFHYEGIWHNKFLLNF